MRRRGTSLLLVLLVAALVITVGFALAGLATLNLNFTRNELSLVQSRYLARAAAAKIEAWVQAHPDTALSLQGVIWDEPGIGQASISFGTPSWFSVDNLLSEVPRASCLDAPGKMTVPAFTADIIVNTTVGGFTRHYEVQVTRRWQYVACSTYGTTAVLKGANAQGWVYGGGPKGPAVSLGAGAIVSGEADTLIMGDDAVKVDPAAVLGGGVVSGVQLSGQQTGDPVALPDPDTSGYQDLATVAQSLPTNGQYASDATLQSFSGFPNHDDVPNGVWLPEIYQAGDLPPANLRGEQRFLLSGTMVLGPDENGHSQSFVVHGGVYNHARLYSLAPPPHQPDGPLELWPSRYEQGTGGKLELYSSVLFVDGGLDVSGVMGNDATLFIKGTMRLDGGSLDAKDKGLVIQADLANLHTSGNFNGMIIGRKSLTLLPSGGGLIINGGLVDNGLGITVGGQGSSSDGSTFQTAVQLTYNPRYTKPLNHFAPTRIQLFREVP